MATTAVQLGAMACLLAAAALVASSPRAGEIASAPDCVDNEPRAIASGGTNGVDSVFAADLDGDGDMDVLSASANDDKIAWFENDAGAPPEFTEHLVTNNADGASAVHAADLDNDGDVDIVSVSANDDTLAWYENVGGSPPLFVERTVTTGARNALAVHVANVDEDNDQDILYAAFDNDTIAICVSDLAPATPMQPHPLPSFTELIVSKTADGAAAVFAADLFSNPQADLMLKNPMEILSASRLGDKIAWYERKFDTTTLVVSYLEHVIDTSADGATSVFAIDLDGAAGVDVLSASANDGRVSWYKSNGAAPPSFTKQVVALLSGASAVFAADLDGDLDADVIAASRLGNRVVWYENLGGGSFGDPAANARILTVVPGPAAIYAVDFDNDGTALDPDIDVLVASSVAGAIAAHDKIALYDSDGGAPPAFTERMVSGPAVAAEALLAVDVDADADVDVVAVNSVDDTIIWFDNDGADPPGFARKLLTDDAPVARGLFWSDLDGDLNQDLVVALAGDDSIAWYRNLGGGDFGDPATNRRPITSFNADGASSVFAIDLDGDGDTDVLSTSENDDRAAWYRNLGGGDFGDPNTNQILITSAADGARSIYAVDFDRDGTEMESDIDVLVASANDDRVVLYLNDGAEAFTAVEITTLADGARSVSAADLDGDGDLDVLVGSANDDTVSWFEQAETEVEDPPDSGMFVTVTTYIEHIIVPTSTPVPASADFVRRALAVDLDADGDLDVVSASSGDDKIAWYQSDLLPIPDPPPDPPVTPVFTARGISTSAESARAVDVADLDGDGALDVVSGFLFGIAWHAGGATEACSSFDVDGDGRIDGVELSWLGAAFGASSSICAGGGLPGREWWAPIDYNRDCLVDGEDLSILTMIGVWGNSTDPQDPNHCAYTCP